MKAKFIALLLALVGVITAKAQYVPGTVTINGLNPDGGLTDGRPVTVSWENKWVAGRTRVTVEVRVAAMINGTNSWFYGITFQTNGSANGSIEFMPRVPLNPAETYRIQAIWRANSFPLDGAQTAPFTITLEKPRSIVARANHRDVKNETRMNVVWRTENIPADATMKVALVPLEGGETGALEQGQVQSDEHMFHFTVTNTPPGPYYLKVFYQTEYGFFGAESQNLLVRVVK